MLFDRYCLENYPGDTMLTQEMVDGWCRQRHTEANNSCRSRIYVVDSFVRFLNGRGLSPVQPPQIPVRKCGLTSPMPLHRKSSAVSSMSATISPSSTTWYYVKKKYKLNVDFFAESTESDSAVFRNHVFQIIQSG